MSLFSTIAPERVVRDRVRDEKASSLWSLGMVAVALVLGVVLGVGGGYFIAANNSAEPAEAETAIAFEDFLRLNTTEMPKEAPEAAAFVVDREVAVDPFIHWNVDSYEGLAPRVGIATEEFLDWNIGSYEGLAPAKDPGIATKEFLEMNIDSLEYQTRYSEQAGGPR